MTAGRIIGPFCQALTLSGTPLRGPLGESSLGRLQDVCVALDQGRIAGVGPLDALMKQFPGLPHEPMEENLVLLPGFLDAHTHLCWAGSRASDFAMRLNGSTYLEIAEAGGGIWSTVQKTRQASRETLMQGMLDRAAHALRNGVTTLEVKSGYGLSLESELRILESIAEAAGSCPASLVPTCLAAHMRARDFPGNNKDYLEYLLRELLPVVWERRLARRIDIFIEQSAFDAAEGLNFLQSAAHLGFDLTVHADQFTTGGSVAAIRAGAVSADHLEASTDAEIAALAASSVVATVLPGASMGLGMPFAPARKLLDAGCCVAIASDWNPGSAPMGELLVQASVLATSEQLTMAEVLAGLTVRAAAALRLGDRGSLLPGMRADLQAYATNDYREIVYNQGRLKPVRVWAGGQSII